jgi:hypothetical protein
MEHLSSAREYLRQLYRAGEVSDSAYFDAFYILTFALGGE